MGPAVEVEIIVSPTLSFALEQSGVPLVRSVSIRNSGSTPLFGAQLRLELAPELGPVQRVGVPEVLPGEAAELGAIDYRLPPGKLRQVTESERGMLLWSLEQPAQDADAAPTVLATGRADVQVLAWNQWPGLRAPPALLASFVTPNHAVIAPLLRKTAERLGGPLDGYQSHDPARVRAQVEALHDVVASLGIAYAEVPASFERSGQKIRLPDQVLSDQLGCCLDLTVLFASCLEQMGLSPVLVVVKGHAFPAVWLVDDRFPEGLVEDAARIRNQLELEQLLLFEATRATGPQPRPFGDAVAAAQKHLRDDPAFVFALDVRACRTEIRPLPVRTVEPSEETEDAAAPPQRVEIIRILRDATRERPPEPERPPVPEDVAARFRRWKDRLLDLTLRNKLLNFGFRTDTKAVLPLRVPDIALFEDLLATGSVFHVIGRPTMAGEDARDEKLARARMDDADVELRRGDLARKILHAALPEERLQPRVKALMRDARIDLEEGGVSTLFAVLGLLKWVEPGTKKDRMAPLVLYPVELGVDRSRGRVTLRRLPGEEPLANVTLIEKMRRDLGVDLSFLAELEGDEAGVNVQALFTRVRQAIQAKSGFEVLEEAHVARLSFAKFLMWKDLEDNADVLLENPVVRHVAGTGAAWQDIPDPMSAERLDHEVPAHLLPTVLDADSTQLAAVVSALRGRSFVLQGPPGTGKSQTITNLIAAAMAEGKRVLFVSEKMAALEVVHQRLQNVGLGDFCLELHSHKANKKDVLASLGAALDRSRSVQVEDWETRSARLTELRNRLNAYAHALHVKRPSGVTVFQALARLRELRDAPEVRSVIQDAAQLQAANVEVMQRAVAAFADRAAVVEPLEKHPWRLAARAGWSASAEARLFDALSEGAGALRRLDAALPALVSTLGVEAPRSLGAVRQLVEVAEAASTGALPLAALEPDFPERAKRAEAWLSADRARAADEAAVLERWTPSLFDLPLPSLLAKFARWAGAFVLFAWLFLWSARRALRRVAKGGALPPDTVVRDDLQRAHTARETARRLEAERASLEGLLDEAVLRRGRALNAAVLLPAEALRDLARRSAAFATERREWLRRQAAAVREAVEALAEAEEKVRVEAEIAPGAMWPLADDPAQLDALGAAFGTLLAARSSWRDACLYREAARALEGLGLCALVAAHGAGQVRASELLPAHERNLLTRWLAGVVDAEPALRQFEARGHERLVEEFAELDHAHIELSRRYVIAALEARLPGEDVAPKELALLRRERAKKMRHIATRRLLAEAQTLVPRLKPCFLMSPLSVAQYLPAGTHFDLVVFDEASQIGTHDAIGAIARGRQVVVVGDSRQLPPTTFFQRAAEDEEALPDENDVAELESVLDEALAKGLPEQMLGWHYRSRHDALIAFSNRHYYGDRLFVFPSARQRVPDLGLKWHPVPEGRYLAGGDRTNPVEAKALVDHLVEQLRRFPPSERSFGVVTFSLAQRELIEDLLDEARAKYPELEPHFTATDGSALFVKNLENVQGDERDEIYFSVGYARDESGRLRMHFGPLSAVGGERRLNVAITRARAQLRVFSTLLPEDIDLSRTRSRGAEHLRAFLQFVARGASARDAGAAPAFETPFHREVYEALTQAGYRVQTSIGCAGYRVDLAVEQPGQPGVFALGVELDGPRWASASSARDRERLRGQVLRGLGWRMHRIYATGWARDPDRERARLLERVAAALGASGRASEAAAS